MFLARLLPRKVYNRIYPIWAHLRLPLEFWLKKGCRLFYTRSILAWVAQKPLGAKSLAMVVRSYREFRRVRNFGANPADDLIYRWLQNLKHCDVFYDIGASNGVFGFAAHSFYQCKTVFVEPYTPSIESILKTIYVTVETGAQLADFEVVHAGLDSEENYARLNMHNPPVPGSTFNTYKNAELYDDNYDRNSKNIAVSQWLKGVSLDKLHFTYNLPAPTHIKIDIDGYEVQAIKGAEQLIASQQVHSFGIEINSEDNFREIKSLLENQNYIELTKQIHYPNVPEHKHFPADYVFIREDLLPQWSHFR